MAGTATDISHHIWEAKYRYVDRRHGERTTADTWRPVARALAVIERDPTASEEKLFTILQDFKFLPDSASVANAHGQTPNRVEKSGIMCHQLGLTARLCPTKFRLSRDVGHGLGLRGRITPGAR